MNLLKIRALARKEFYHLIRDYRSLYLAFAIPLMLIVLFGYALSLDVDNVDTVVVDYDRSDISRDLSGNLRPLPTSMLRPRLQPQKKWRDTSTATRQK